MFLTATLRLVGFTLGSSIYVFLGVLLARRRGAGWPERLWLAAVSVLGLWHAANAVAQLREVAAGVASPGWLYAGADSAPLVFVSLLPGFWLIYRIYRYNFLGLLISRRLVFALTLGVLFAIYLVAVRRAAGYLEDEFQALGPLVEVALLLAAALVWLPLYGWMTRFFAQRTQLYADFSKRLIEDAARILELGPRVQFLAEELGRSFGLYRVLLITTGERLHGQFGPPAQAVGPQLARLESLARERRAEMIHAERSPEPEPRALLAGLRFNYLFPLSYEDRLIGLLLLDTSPRRFLDENETILLGLSRQISHSIETCRVIEGKIGLERALARQEHLASLGKVAATIAHEIKNPLSSIKTLAQLMREDPEVERRYARDLSYVIGETDRLNRSVLQLLSFSRPAPEQETEVNVAEILETTAEVLARQHAAAGIRVEHRVEPGLRLRRANPEMVKQIVLNLALNAIQASPPEGRVSLEGQTAEDGKIRIAVTDQGPGIPAEIRERIFEPFFTTKQKGTGLGLAIVRKNVRHLNGEIHIESPVADGRGTRVSVTLGAS